MSILVSPSGMVETPRLPGEVDFAKSPEETSQISLARLRERAEVRVRRIEPPHPYPLPHQKRGGEGTVLVGFEPTTFGTPRLPGEGCLV